MFKKIVSSPRWYGFNVLVPAGGLAIGNYATGLRIPQGANFVWVRQNIVTPTGNVATQIDYGTSTVFNQFGTEFEPQFAFNNLFALPFNFSDTEIFFSVVGDVLLTGNFNIHILVLEGH
jgi:hypothetical protein